MWKLVNVSIGTHFIQPPQRPIQAVHHERRPLHRSLAVVRHHPHILEVDVPTRIPLLRQMLRNGNAIATEGPTRGMSSRLPALMSGLYSRHPLRVDKQRRRHCTVNSHTTLKAQLNTENTIFVILAVFALPIALSMCNFVYTCHWIYHFIVPLANRTS